MALAAAALRKRWVPDSQGRLNGNYPLGDDPAQDIELSIREIPAISTQVSLSYTLDMRQYVNVPASGTVTLSLEGSVTGWALDVDDLEQTGATPGVGTLTLVATHSSGAVASRTFSVESFAAADPDTAAPSYITRYSLSQEIVGGVPTVTATVYLPCDPRVAAENPSGLATLIPTRDTVDQTPVAVSAGISPQLVGTDLGTGTGGSVTQTGNDYDMTIPVGTSFGGSGGENGYHAHFAVSGDGWYSVYIPDPVGAVTASSSAWLRIASSLDAAAVMTMAYVNTDGSVRPRIRFAANTASSAGTNQTGSPGVHVGALVAGGQVTLYFSRETKPVNWSVLAAAQTLGLGSTYYVTLGGAVITGGATSMTVAFQNFVAQTLAPVTLTDTPGAGAHTYSFRVTDGATNESDDSAELSITVEAAAADTTAPTTPVIAAVGGQGIITISVTTPSTDASPPVSYRYYRSANPAELTELLATTTDTSYVHTVADSTTLSYIVTAVDNAAALNVSAQSNRVSATSNDPVVAEDPVTAAPTNFVFAGLNTSSVRGTWTMAVNSTRTMVIWGLAADELTNVIPDVLGTSYDVTGLAPGTQVYMRLRGQNDTTTGGGPKTATLNTEVLGSNPSGVLRYDSHYDDSTDALRFADNQFPTNEQGNFTGAAASPRGISSTTHRRAGARSVLHYVNRTDSSPTNTPNHRSEILQKGIQDGIEWGKVYWYGASIYLDDTFAQQDGDNGEVIQQFHVSAWTNGVGNNPPVSTVNEHDNTRLIHVSHLTNTSVAPTSNQDNKTSRNYTLGTAWPRNVWIDFVWRVRWAWWYNGEGPGGLPNGLFQLWCMPVPGSSSYAPTQLTLPAVGSASFSGGNWLINDSGPNTFNTTLSVGTGYRPNFKNGIYKPAWRLRTSPNATLMTNGRRCWTDEFKMAAEEEGGSFNLVRPDGVPV